MVEVGRVASEEAMPVVVDIKAAEGAERGEVLVAGGGQGCHCNGYKRCLPGWVCRRGQYLTHRSSQMYSLGTDC